MNFVRRPRVSSGARRRQGRHTWTRPPRRPATGARLAAWVALSVSIVLAAATFAAVLLAERQLDADLRETARVTAVALADEIELQDPPITRERLAPLLGDFMNAANDLEAIHVFVAANDTVELLASTSEFAQPPANLVTRAMTAGEPVWNNTSAARSMVAVPVYIDDQITGAVTVSVSMASLGRLRRVVGTGAIAAGLITIAVVTLVVYLLARRIILGPYESLLQLREAAARAQQLAAVGQTMANVAHQIGTPLNLVSGHVQLLQQEVSDPGLKRRLTIVEEQVDRVTSAVRDLLQRARPSAQPRLVDVTAMLRRVTDATRGRFAAAAVAIVMDISSDLPTVTADETQLELALLNLLANAVDAMPGGGVVTVSASRLRQGDGGHARSSDGIRIEVSDTGNGIAPELLPRIFEPWVTTKPADRGTGLGLSIARDVITRAGGTIAVQSTPAHGTTFTIDLPASATA